ncbi:glycine zipper domain-containing protein [Burkholderia sp. GbtcB21]|uniref:YMGG-like glycine zipper-containing protein n=1 Tax=Burkholderia sp. GbtcB21 TaxID=2824766 RepID=UPI001C30AA22|nr:glycine zipper domain-containing protein [Burkholderia sp. GbtcB21]
MESTLQRSKSECQGKSEEAHTRRFACFVICLVTLTVTGFASAQQQPIFYPAKEQSAQKQQTDTAECQVWAKQTTGVDPVALAQRSASPPAPQPPQGGPVTGAAGGAAMGAAIGAIAGDAGKGAAIGAVTGTAGGGMRRLRREQAAAQQQQATQSSTASQLSTFTRAVTACMNGRGYTSQ